MNQSARKVIITPADPNLTMYGEVKKNSVVRMCAYARVSTKKDEQKESLKTQELYYKTEIPKRENCVFAGIYADKKSGTSAKRRPGFTEMMADSRAHKFDYIICKATSRFARNTAELLQFTRELRELGIGVIFEIGSIDTLTMGSEIVLTCLAAVDQDYSRGMSDNIKMGKRMKAKNGNIKINVGQTLGYKRNDKGEIIIDEKGAETVRFIFHQFQMGYGYRAIAKQLIREGRTTVTGKLCWDANAVKNILTNEIYIGTFIYQKTICTDFISKKVIKNKGQLEKYTFEDNHPAIIDKETFDMVQIETEHRATTCVPRHSEVLFSGQIKCGHCGATYQKFTQGASTKYAKEMYRCKNRYGKNGCTETPALRLDIIKSAVATAMELLFADTEVVDMLKLAVDQPTTIDRLNADLEKLAEKELKINDKMLNLNEKMKTTDMLPSEYNAIRAVIAKEYEDFEKKKEEIQTAISDIEIVRKRRERMMNFLENKPIIDEFDDMLWRQIGEKIIVQPEILTIIFCGGVEIDVKL